jgi:hypothetical protein
MSPRILRRRARNRSGERGVSTLESLVSITVLAMLTLGLQSLLGSALRISTGVKVQAEHRDAVDTARRVIATTVGNAVPEALDATRDRHFAHFVGSAIGFTTLTELPLHLTGGGRQVVRIALTQDPPQLLVMRWHPELAAGEGAPRGSRQITLLENLSSVRFQYLGPRDPGAAPQWSNVWRDESRLPTLVRVEVTFRSGPTHTWIPLLVPTKATATGLCEIDPLTSRCRHI